MVWDNPIWTYRIRAHWWRRLPAPARAIAIVLALAAAAASSWLVTCWAAGEVATAAAGRHAGLARYTAVWFSAPIPQRFVNWVYSVYSILAACAGALCGSLAIVRDRQRGTWDAMILSRLRPREIIVGKFAVALIPCVLLGLWALPVWVGMFFSFEHVGALWKASAWPPWAMILWICVRALGRPLPFLAMGLYVSLGSRSLVDAVSVATGLTCVVLMACHSLIEDVPYDSYTIELIPVWFLSRWVFLQPAVTESNHPFVFLRIWSSHSVLFLSAMTDFLWIALVPSLLLRSMIRRFHQLDRKIRGDIRGRGAGSHEPTAKDQVQEPSP